MKKATAFLTLVFLIALVFLVFYINDDRVYPTWRDLEPATSLLKGFIAEAWQKPLLGGLAVFWVSAFLLSLMVLREPSTRQLNQTKPVEAGKTNAAQTAAAEEMQKLAQKIAATEKERDDLKQGTIDMQGQIHNLLGQLEKCNANAGRSEVEAQLKKQFASSEEALTAANSALGKAESEIKSANYDKNRLTSENEALISKIEKTEQESKSARKESEKIATQLKNAISDSDKKSEELNALKLQLESLTQEFKSAQANIKGGKDAIPPAAYQILYLFQKEGRLIDLLCEDISQLDDETLGGAIRPIHEGCRKLLVDRLILERVLNEEEGSEVTVDEIDPEAIKLSGKVPSKGPYKGELIHGGWRLKECNLPELVDGWKGNVIAPAEIEIS